MAPLSPINILWFLVVISKNIFYSCDPLIKKIKLWYLNILITKDHFKEHTYIEKNIISKDKLEFVFWY